MSMGLLFRYGGRTLGRDGWAPDASTDGAPWSSGLGWRSGTVRRTGASSDPTAAELTALTSGGRWWPNVTASPPRCGVGRCRAGAIEIRPRAGDRLARIPAWAPTPDASLDAVAGWVHG